jgi:hypothetical protein
VSLRSRYGLVIQIGTLLALTVLTVSILGLEDPGMAFQSPVSPLRSPVFLPQPGPPRQEPVPTRQPSRGLSSSLWTSPLPWIAVGLIVFGGLGGVLYVVLRHFESMAE